MMRLVAARPPNYETIVAAFPFAARAPGVMFTYGDTIFKPDGKPLPDKSLWAHEEVHCRQQGRDPAGWWERYIAEAAFRFAQELEAHVREYEVACAGLTRNQRRQTLRQIANRLAGPLYGGVVTKERAKALIVRGAGE